jgi:hypothetical protein
MIPKDTRTPTFYSLPKTRKLNVPLWPTVRATGSPTHHFNGHLHRILLLIILCPASYVHNSQHFVQILNQLTITEDYILISSDVESLFTTVPIHYIQGEHNSSRPPTRSPQPNRILSAAPSSYSKENSTDKYKKPPLISKKAEQSHKTPMEAQGGGEDIVPTHSRLWH